MVESSHEIAQVLEKSVGLALHSLGLPVGGSRLERYLFLVNARDV